MIVSEFDFKIEWIFDDNKGKRVNGFLRKSKKK